MLTISRTEDPSCRMCTGRAMPMSTGSDDLRAAYLVQQLVGDIARGEVREDQGVHPPGHQVAEGVRLREELGVQGDVRLDLAINGKPG